MKTKLLALSAILFSISINAQIDFAPHITIDATGGTNNPISAYAADLDGDGDLDMISASRSDDKIAWYENLDGQGNYGPQQIISDSFEGAYSVFAADLDGDGDMDVLAATSSGNSIGWFENLNGQGNFGNYQPISTLIDGPTSVYAFDADGDGDMDVFSTSGTDHKIAWYKNIDGQGNFGPQQIISTNYDIPVYITSGDIDGDGYMDIISGNSYQNGSIAWFKNNDGLGNFVEQQILTTDLSFCKSAVLVDLDGDGDLDIAAVSRRSNSSAAIWFENTDGQGNFNNTPKVIGTLNSTDAIFAADFDNDGDNDIAVGSAATGIYWFKNNGSGIFGNEQVIDEDVSGVNTLIAADIDNDGKTDLVMVSGREDRVSWYKNTNGQGNFSSASEISAINGANGPQQVISADLDGDGDKDIIAALRNGDRIVWQENLDGQGTFSELKTIGYVKNPWAVYPGNIDGDGFIDIIAATANRDAPLLWYKNIDGQGNFGPGQVIFNDTFNYTEAVYLTDIDNDGDLDVFSYNNTNFFWLENLDGQGNFGDARIISSDLFLIDSFIAADIDGDGDKDMVASYWGDGTVAWFENLDGQGNFGPANIIDILNSSDSVAVADFDNDGDIDVVTLDFINDQVMWYENTDGQGTFGSAQIISNTVSRPMSLYAKDLDNDGNVDVICTAYSTGEIIWFKNDGNGNFNYEQIIGSNVKSPISVFADDLNGDGKIDVLTYSLTKDEIIWFENKGPLGIEENSTSLFNIYPNPTTGFLNIKSTTPIAEITVYNNIGQFLISTEEKNQVDISTLSEGIYFVKIKDNNGSSETKKIVKK